MPTTTHDGVPERREPERDERRPEQQQRADRLVEPDQPLVGVDARGDLCQRDAPRPVARRRRHAVVHAPSRYGSQRQRKLLLAIACGATSANSVCGVGYAQAHAQLALHPLIGKRAAIRS